MKLDLSLNKCILVRHFVVFSFIYSSCKKKLIDKHESRRNSALGIMPLSFWDLKVLR